MTSPFTYRFRVRYSEVDPQAVVFNARYLDYADLAVTEFFRAMDIGFVSDEPMEFHVAHAEVTYRAPLRADQWVEARLSLTRFGNSSMAMVITLHGEADGVYSDEPHAEVALVQVHVDLPRGKPLRIPDDLRERLTPYLADAPEKDSAHG